VEVTASAAKPAAKAEAQAEMPVKRDPEAGVSPQPDYDMAPLNRREAFKPV